LAKIRLFGIAKVAVFYHYEFIDADHLLGALSIGLGDEIIISGGKIIGQGTSAELKGDRNPYVKQFMQGLPDGAVPFHYGAKDYAEDLFRY